MATVRITFDYEPDEPDPSDSTGMSEGEHLRVTEALMELGAMNVRIERPPSTR